MYCVSCYLIFLTCMYFLNEILCSDSFSLEQKQKIESGLLEFLDISEKPSVKEKRESHFLLEAYKFLQNYPNDGVHRHKRQALLTLDEQQKIRSSDVIMSFENISKDKNGLKLLFDIFDIPRVEEVIAAELRFIHTNTFEINHFYKKLTLTAYTLTETQQTIKLASKTISASYSGWIILDLTSCIRSWLKSNHTKQTILLSFQSYDNQVAENLEPDGIRTYIVGYFKANNTVKVRKSRDVFMKNFTDLSLSEESNLNSKRCTPHHFVVSFTALGWDDWIIAPQNFSSSYCEGSCRFPNKYGENATNHAIIQTLVHIRQPHRYPLPCCAPDQMTELAVLYQRQNVILKKYQNMIVQSCGCH